MEYSVVLCFNRRAKRRMERANMKLGRGKGLAGALGLVVALWLGWVSQAQAQGGQAQGGDVIVFAAASLKNALDAINAQWQQQTGKKASISYGASSALAKQLEQAAPAQMFISADQDWMDYVANKNLIKPETRSNLLGNRLVLIAPKAGAEPVEIKAGFDLAKILGSDGRLAMANVDAVPAGKYGKAALEKLGVWAGVANRVAQAENVRAALLLVSRGEAPAGIVYQTDAAADANVKIIGTFPESSHPRIIYPVALTPSATPDALALLSYLTSAQAKPLFEAQGFTVLAAGRS
jgi:molybdate transport system substrate-binding protein